MKKIFVLVGIIICLMSSTGYGDSISSPEEVQIGFIAQAARLSSTVGSEGAFTRWEQLAPLFDLSEVNKSLIAYQAYPLEDHYQFITQPLPLLREEGRVLLIRTIPLEDVNQPDLKKREQRRWRYLVYQRKDGQILSGRMPENEVQLMLKRSGVTITPKAGLPAVENEERLTPLAYPDGAERSNSHTGSNQYASDWAKVSPSQIVLTVRSSPGVFIFAAIVLTGLLVGAIVFFRKRK